MKNWRDKLDDFMEKLENNKLFENSYKITYPCRYKRNGRWIKAKICFETGEIFINKKVVRRCSICKKFN